MTLERSTIAADGADLAVWRRPGEGRWIVLVHGSGVDHAMWDAVVERLPGASLLLVDLRGHGASRLLAGRRVAFEDVVADLGRVLDAVGVHRAVLLAHSWGGNVAQEWALRHPERVEALVLAGTWGQHRPWGVGDELGARLSVAVQSVLPWRRVARASARWGSTDAATQAIVERGLLATGRRAYLDAGRSAHRAIHADGTPPAAVPTLLVRGEHEASPTLDRIWAGILAANPMARVAVVPGVGHLAPVDAPDAFVGEALAFLDGLDEH